MAPCKVCTGLSFCYNISIMESINGSSTNNLPETNVDQPKENVPTELVDDLSEIDPSLLQAKDVLRYYIESDRPDEEDFLGTRPYYTREYIDDARKVVGNKEFDDGGISPELSNVTEYVVTYLLGFEHILPGCQARVASHIDDQLNGVDVICQIPYPKDERYYPDGSAKKGSLVFGLDVTMGIDEDYIVEKIRRGDRRDDSADEAPETKADDSKKKQGGGNRNCPNGCTYIKFFQDMSNRGYHECLKGVPRFVVGTRAMFLTQKYLSDFKIDPVEECLVHEPNSELNFKILSSLYMQSANFSTRLKKEADEDNLITDPEKRKSAISIRERAIKTCTEVRRRCVSALANLMNVKTGDEFMKKLNETVRRLQFEQIKEDDPTTTDLTYTYIVKEAVGRSNTPNKDGKKPDNPNSASSKPNNANKSNGSSKAKTYESINKYNKSKNLDKNKTQGIGEKTHKVYVNPAYKDRVEDTQRAKNNKGEDKK